MLLNLYNRIIRQLVTGKDSDAAIAIIGAHPDDEVIGMGGKLASMKNALFIHITDGAPRNMIDAAEKGFKNRRQYAWSRNNEFRNALLMAQIDAKNIIEMGIADQEASENLLYIIYELTNIFVHFRIDAVFTHPYEGGHPDHDAASIAVHAAAYLIKRTGFSQPLIFEFASYHAKNTAMACFEFLEFSDPGLVIPLTGQQMRLKTDMINCFKTQRAVLEQFPISKECFRISPRYNFTLPPHQGQLYYENFDWGINGLAWRHKASEVIRKLNLAEII